MGKKSQITPFIIVGLVVVALVSILLLTLNQQNGEIKSSLEQVYYFNQQQNVLDSFIGQCVKQTTVDAELQVGIDPLMSRALMKQYILDNLPTCLDDFTVLKKQGFDVVKEDLTVNVDITDDAIVTVVSYPVVLTKADTEIKFFSRSYRFPRTVMEVLNKDGPTRVVSPDGSTIIEVPQDTVVTLNGQPVDKVGFKLLDRNFNDLSNNVLAGMLAFEGLPQGAVFSKPVKIIKYFRDSDMSLLNEIDDLGIAYYDTQLGLWVGLPTEIDASKKKLTSEIMHFTPLATVTDCKAGTAGKLVLEDIVTPKVVTCTGWKSEPLPWKANIGKDKEKGPNVQPDGFTCDGFGYGTEWKIYYKAKSLTEITGKGDASPFVGQLAPEDVINLDLENKYTGTYYKDCSKSYTYDMIDDPSVTVNPPKIPDPVTHTAKKDSCEAECPKDSAKFCTDDNLGTISCEAIFFGFNYNEGKAADGENRPSAVVNSEVVFDKKGDACIYDPSGDVSKKITLSEAETECAGTDFTGDAAKCIIKSGSTPIITITPTCPDDKCIATKGKLKQTDPVSPVLDFNLYVVNKESSATEVCIKGGADVALAGVGIANFSYNCIKKDDVKVIGTRCYVCDGTFFVEDKTKAKCTQKVEVNGPCLSNYDGKKYCDGKDLCLICSAGIWNKLDYTECAACQNYKATTPTATVIGITGKVTGSDPSSQSCLTPTNTNPFPSGPGPSTDKCASVKCEPGFVCNPSTGKCDKQGGLPGENCEFGDPEVKRYPPCEDQALYVNKSFKLKTGEVLDTRDMKFCDHSYDFSDTSTTLLVFGSALRQGECWVLVEPKNDNNDYYMRKKDFLERTTPLNDSTPVNVVPAPKNLNNQSQDNQSVYLTWDVESKAEYYLVFMDSVNIANTSNGTVAYYNATGLQNNTAYLFSVKAFNSTFTPKESNFSNVVNTTTYQNNVILSPSQTPAPLGLIALSRNNESVYLVWDPVDKAINYSIFMDVVYYDNSLKSRYNTTGLTSHTKYYFKVRAYSESFDIRESNFSDVVEIDTLENNDVSAKTQTPAPVDLAAASKTNDSIYLEWSPVTGAEQYVIYRNDVLLLKVLEPKYNDTKLIADTPYEYSVTAFSRNNDIFESNRSGTLTETTLKNKELTAPKSLFAQSRTNDSIYLMWLGAPDTDNYQVYVYLFDGTIETMKSVAGTSINITALENNTEYAFNMTSVYVGGSQSSYSNTVEVRTMQNNVAPVTQTAAPRELGSNNIKQDQVTLSWDADSGLDDFRIYKDGEYIAQTSEKLIIISNLTKNTDYWFNVTAYDQGNDIAESNFSNTLKVKTGVGLGI